MEGDWDWGWDAGEGRGEGGGRGGGRGGGLKGLEGRGEVWNGMAREGKGREDCGEWLSGCLTRGTVLRGCYFEVEKS